MFPVLRLKVYDDTEDLPVELIVQPTVTILLRFLTEKVQENGDFFTNSSTSARTGLGYFERRNSGGRHFAPLYQFPYTKLSVLPDDSYAPLPAAPSLGPRFKRAGGRLTAARAASARAAGVGPGSLTDPRPTAAPDSPRCGPRRGLRRGAGAASAGRCGPAGRAGRTLPRGPALPGSRSPRAPSPWAGLCERFVPPAAAAAAASAGLPPLSPPRSQRPREAGGRRRQRDKASFVCCQGGRPGPTALRGRGPAPWPRRLWGRRRPPPRRQPPAKPLLGSGSGRLPPAPAIRAATARRRAPLPTDRPTDRPPRSGGPPRPGPARHHVGRAAPPARLARL